MTTRFVVNDQPPFVAASEKPTTLPTLEISSKSPDALGRALSAMNLHLTTPLGRLPVECIYQASKVFQNGGPYTHLLRGNGFAAKSDPRLRSSGRLTAFRFNGKNYTLEPKTLFYDALWIGAFAQNGYSLEHLKPYTDFTDRYHMRNSLACQARSAALYASLTIYAADPAAAELLQLLRDTYRQITT